MRKTSSILDRAHHFTPDDRLAAHAKVRSTRLALRSVLLARDPEGYREALPLPKGGEGSAHLSDAELIAADLGADHNNKALDAIATSEERRAFDRAVLDAVEVNLWLLPALRERLSGWRSVGDPEEREGLMLTGLEHALGTFDPELGALTKHAYLACYTVIRRYYRGETRRARPRGEFGNGNQRGEESLTVASGLAVDRRDRYEPRVPDANGDPFLRAQMLEVWDGLTNVEQEILAALVKTPTRTRADIAEDLGLSRSALSTRLRRIRPRFERFLSAVA